MSKILKFLFLIFIIGNVSQVTSEQLEQDSVYVLDIGNHFVLRSQIDDKSVDKLLYEVYTTDLSDTTDVFIYIYSPGGYVISGHRVIRLLESWVQQGKEIHCIADFAGSMAFAIFQSCTHRYVMPGSILFHHQVSTSVKGTMDYIEKNLEFVKDMTCKMDKIAADKMGMSVEEFRNYFVEDREVYSNTALEMGMADKSINIRCSSELTSSNITVISESWLGEVEITYSKCPLLHNPLTYSIID